jgi:pimeloyl-ACP methyl ester carboxylesterase/Tfp pilus assembly protein PilF
MSRELAILLTGLVTVAEAGPAPSQMERATVQGVELEYQVRGTGEPVVLIHNGVGVDWYEPLVAESALARRYRLITYHRAGYAGSGRVTGPIDFAQEALHCRSLLRYLGIARAHVVGHSSSAMIALKLALDAPDTVASLGLLEPALMAVPSPPEVPRAIELYRAGDKPTAVDTFFRGTCGDDYRAKLDRTLPGAFDRALAGADRFFGQELPALRQMSFGPDEAKRVTQPALAVMGAKTGEKHRQRRDLMLQWLPSVEPFVLPDAGHLLHLENPRGLAEGLSSFFARHPIDGPMQRGGGQGDPHVACASMGWVPRDVLERPVALRTGVGNARERVTTASPESQALYDQGLAYLHGYVWIEAARSFHQALRADPRLAMAWVGLSRVYSGLEDPRAAREALSKAEALAFQATPREQRRVALRARQLDAMEDAADAARHAAYKKAIDEALALDIGDPELWLLRGNAEEPTAAGRGQRGGAASTAFYLEAIRLSPDNAAAHHYLTHSYEQFGQIALALEHGEAFARLAPSVPHAHHMWGHDLRRTGRIDEAIAAFNRTDDLEKAYYAAERIPAALDWHHVHNLDLLATAYQHKGQMKKAEAVMREAAALPPAIDRVEFDQKQLAAFLLGRQRWDEALQAAERLAQGRWAASRAVSHALAGQAQAAKGRTAEARAALEAADRELAAVPAFVVGIGVGRGQVQPWIDTLRGELLLRDGSRAEGRRLLESVARTLRVQPGPDAWMQALFRLEAIARLAREIGDWELAGFMGRQMVEHDAAYAGSHLALALVAEHHGDRRAASASRAEAKRYWRDADPDLPELALLRTTSATPISAPASEP